MSNPKNLWDLLQNKTKKPISKDVIQDIAKGVKKEDQDNEQKMRQLVRTLSSVAGIKLTPEKEEDILKYLKENKFTGLESINKLLNNRK